MSNLTVYLNGEYVAHKDAKVSVDDRGFLFADGIYEVMKLQGKFIFTADEHLARLRRGLSDLRIQADAEVDKLPEVLRRLVEINKLEGECYCYIQVTRGAAAARAHAWHGTPVVPTVYAIVKPFSWPKAGAHEQGNGAITVPDARWARCDIKTVSLLPNILANQRAKEAGCYEALLLRPLRLTHDGTALVAGGTGAGAGGTDGTEGQLQECIVEASHSNVFAVMRHPVHGTLSVVTPPQSNILPGITRLIMNQRTPTDSVLQQALKEAGVDTTQGTGGLIEAPIPLSGLKDGRILELFVTASTTFVMPVVTVDGVPVGPPAQPQPAAETQDPHSGNLVCHSYLPGEGWVKGRVGPVSEAYRLAWQRWWAEDKAKAEQQP